MHADIIKAPKKIKKRRIETVVIYGEKRLIGEKISLLSPRLIEI